MSVEYKIYLDPLPSSALDTDNEEQRPGNCSADARDHCIPCFAAELCHSECRHLSGPKAGPGMHSGQITSYLRAGGVRCGPGHLIPQHNLPQTHGRCPCHISEFIFPFPAFLMISHCLTENAEQNSLF